jgi:glycerophosphoryl diester phosphodiesterase
MLRIAHRGGAMLKPENTLAAFADSIARGDDGAELDVQLTRDGHVIVFHDFRLKPDICRGANGEWLKAPTQKIRDLKLEDLKTLDVGRPRPGSVYARTHPGMEGLDGERIPLLSEVVDLARQAPKTFRLFVELKTSFTDPNLSASPKVLAEKTTAVLRDAHYLDRTVLVGFDWRGLLYAKSLEPKVECWFTTLAQSWFRDGDPPPQDEPPAPAALQLLRHFAKTGTSPWAAGFDAVKFGGSILQAIKAAGGDGWFPYFPDATPEAIAEAHALGLRVGAWTVDDPADMRGLIARDIDAICTDRPDVLKAL